MMSKKSIFAGVWMVITCSVLWPATAISQKLLPPNQPEQTACNAIPLCGGKFYNPYSYQGTGPGVDLAATPCSTPAETNTMWMKITIAGAGKLSFEIIPVDPLDDYDFAVLDITTTPCDSLTPGDVVRCNYNNDEPGTNATGTVGLSDTATNPFVKGGVYGWPFAQSIDATPGQTFLILVNNFGHDASPGPSHGFTIDFTSSTATFVPANPPAFKEIVKQCSDSSVIVQLTRPVLCSSIAADGSGFSISGITVTGATGTNCASDTGYTSTVLVSFAGHYPPGSYTVAAKTSSSGTGIIDICGDPLQLPQSLPFTIPPPPATPNISPADTTKCDYSTISLIGPTGFPSYLWSTGGNTSTIAVADPGTYTLQVTDANGCKASASAIITDSSCPQYVYLPNAFSPNHDGRNDIFRPTFAGPTSGFRFAIYDRWGRLMFQTQDPAAGWDGTTGGKEQPVGVYVWVCVYKLYEQPERMQRGTVMLIR
ncbi:MAG TPA: gliding motility-associated C-terminal domain-containing protein [Puia sp.]|nr:gliding motility-associated C-terminal domain-containing protein [Puia sp.]